MHKGCCFEALEQELNQLNEVISNNDALETLMKVSNAFSKGNEIDVYEFYNKNRMFFKDVNEELSKEIYKNSDLPCFDFLLEAKVKFDRLEVASTISVS